MAKYVAKELGYEENEIEFKETPSAQRETAIQGGQVALIFATYSITDARKEKVSFAGPYFVAGQDLLVAADNTDITGPDTMNGKTLCSVTGSTPAEKIKKEYSTSVELFEQDTYSKCVEALVGGTVDAVTTDNVILAGFAAQPQYAGKLKVVGKPFSTENYGVGLKKGDTELCGKVNAALEKMVSDGSWQKAVDANVGPVGVQGRHRDQPAEAGGLLVVAVERMGAGLRRPPPRPSKGGGGLGELLAEYDVLGAFWMTIKLTVAAALGALVLGTVIAVMRVSPVGVLRAFGTAYVTLVRNTPLTLIVFFCAFGFYITLQYRIGAQDSPIDVQNFRWGVLGLAVYHAAFVAEALRSGINTVPKGQAEAARAIGLDFGTTLTQVVLPQAFRGAIAPLGNVLIALTKNTTVVATIGVAEASYLMKGMIEFRPDLIYAIFVIMATGFVILTLPIGVLFTSLSRRLAVRR